jgi:hypothetical protein
VAAGDGKKGAGDALDGSSERPSPPAPPADGPPEAELYPPGPLEAAKIIPGTCRLLIGAEKVFQARATDATGRILRDGVAFRWSLPEGPGRLEAGGSSKASYRAEAAGAVRISLEARQGDRAAVAEARIEVLEELEAPGREDVGIPDPVEVKDPDGRWRSRLREGKWEFNASHPDYLMASAEPGRRFRYLATLLAKEFVLRQVSGGPGEDRLLESLVEVLSAIEERLGRPARKEKP